MITLLANIFIKSDKEDKVRKVYGTLCSIVGIMLNILLFLGKFVIGSLSGSIAIQADAFNNLSDAGSSIITLVGFRLSGKKPDIEHPFGHGRIEYISGLGVAVLIILMGFELARSSVEKIIHPTAVDIEMVTFVVLIMSILVKLYMFYYNNSIGEKIDSAAMKATAVDSISDVGATSVVLIAALINKYVGINVDGICGLIVALLILKAGYEVAKDTISPLLGQPPKKEFVDQIVEIVMAHEGIVGIHDLVVHDYGPGRVMISLHTEVPGDGDIFVIHDMIDRVEKELKDKLNCDAVIHMDPIEVNNEVVNTTRKIVKELLKKIDENLSMHDFRMVTGETHTNLIFDVVLPYTVKMEPDELKEKIQEVINGYDNHYYTVVTVDRDYVL
jgi:cation diffusion facilitator family transporter